MPGKILPAMDPGPAFSIFSTAAPTARDRGRMVDEMFTMNNAWDNGGRTRDDVLGAVTDARSRYARLSAGHLPFPYDVVDDVQNGLALFKTFVDAGPAVGELVGPFGPLLTKAALVPIQSLADTAGDVLAIPGVQNVISDWRARNGAVAVADMTEANESLLKQAVEAMVARVNADTTGEYARAVAAAFPQLVGNADKADLTAGGCVEQHPEIFNSYSTTIVVQSDSSVVINDIDATRQQVLSQVSGVSSQVQAGFTAVGSELATINAQNQQISAGVGGLANFLHAQASTQAQRDAVEAARKRAADTMTAVWSGAQGVVTGASAVADLLGDKQLAKDINRYGASVITVAKSVVAFADALSAITKGLNAISAFGAAAATGNVLGAVAGFVGLFTAGGPTPEEQILKEVGKIEQGLSDLSHQMADGFNRLDERLNVIYTNLMSSLRDISVTVNLTYEQVLAIERRLVEQERELNVIVVEMSAFFRAEERRPLREDINTALDWTATNSEPMTGASFGLFSGHFYTWATDTALDAINQPLQGRAVDSEHVGAQLAGQLSDNVSYLNRYLVTRGLPSLSADVPAESDRAPLPNPAIWALSASAYAQLRAEQRGLAATDDARGKRIRATGDLLRKAIQRLAAEPALFEQLINDYLAAADGLGAALDTRRAVFQREVLPVILGHPNAHDEQLTGTVDLFAGTDQPFSFQPRFDSAHAAKGGGDLPAPDRMFRFIPPLFLLAAYCSPGSPPLDCQWSTHTYVEDITHVNPKTGDEVVEHQHRIRVDVDITWDGVVVGGPSVEKAGAFQTDAELRTWIGQNWTQEFNLLQRLNTMYANQPPVAQTPSTVPADVVARATEVARNGLLRARSAFYADLAAQCATGDTRLEAARLDGTRAVIENLARLLLPTPRSGDDLLRAIFDGPSPSSGGTGLIDLAILDHELGMIDTASLPGTDSARRMTSWLEGLVADPANRLRDRLTAWQQAIVDQHFSNALPDLDDALLRLDVADYAVTWHAMAQRGVAPPADNTPVRALQGAIHLPPTGTWDESTDTRLQLIELAAFTQQRPDVPALQRALGVQPDGKWGPKSKAALIEATKKVQLALGVTADGAWGPKTDTAYHKLRERLHHPTTALVHG